MTAHVSRLAALALLVSLATAAPRASAQSPESLAIAAADRTLPAAPAAARLANVWQPTINHLTRADATTARLYSRHNARTAELLGDLRRGRTQTLVDYVSADVMPHGPTDVARVVRLLEETHGAIIDYSVHGTMPRTEQAVYTFAEVRFADGSRSIVRVTWKDEALVSFVHAEPLFASPTAATAGAPWQAAIDELANVSDGQAAQFDAYNATAGRLLRGLQNGNDRLLYRQLRADRQERGTEDVARMLDVFVAEHGAITQTSVLGTLPRTDRSAYTFAELTFADGRRTTFRLTWLDGRLTGLVASPPLITMMGR